MKEQLILLLFLLCRYDPVSGQIPGMRKYTQHDGYKASAGYAIRQDEKGYMWIGTDNGGVRFDGKTFKELQPIHNSVNSEVLGCIPLPGKGIACIPITGDIYILDHDTLINFGKKNSLRKQATRQGNTLMGDTRTGAEWLWDGSVQTHLYKFSRTTVEEFIKAPDDFHMNYIINDQFVGTNDKTNRLGFYDIRSNRVRNFYHADGTMIHPGKELLLKLLTSYDKILTYEYERRVMHVYKWVTGDSILEEVNQFPFLMVNPLVTAFSSYSKGGKQYLFNRQPDNSIAYCKDVAAENTAENILYMKIPGVLNGFCVDQSNNLWMTSSDNALYFLSEKHMNNALMVSKVPLKYAIPKSIAGVGGRICIGYPNSNVLTLLSAAGPRHFTLKQEFKNGGSRNMEVLNDSIISFYGSDIGLLNTRTNTITYLNHNLCIKDICLYKEGLLGASCGDVYFFEKHRGSYTRRSVFGMRRSTAITVTPGDEILVGTPAGIYRKQGINAEAVLVRHPLLQEQNITDILLLDDSSVLISTNSSGLYIYRLDNTAYALTSPASGNVIPRHIRQLYRQDSNTFWAATDEGVCAVKLDGNLQLQSVRNYTFYDGLPSNNVTGVYAWQDTAYIATAEGLGVIPLKDTAILTMAAPRIYIDKLHAGIDSFNSPEAPITLSHNHKDLRLLLSGISYESLGNVRYTYRLNPFQADWIETTEPDIRFTRLPPGHYVFEAFATNAKGVKSEVLRLQIFLKPAYWQTVYFQTGLALLAVAILFVLIRWQLKRSEKKRYMAIQQKKHFAELELEAIKAQINPHFIYNCLNSIQYLNYKADYEQAQQYLGMFSRLIRMTMQYSQKVFITVQEEVAYLSAYLQMEQLRFKDKLRYTIDVDNKVEQHTLIPAMLLQPYVENALKHGISGLPGGGKISLSFRKEDEDLEIMIRDNGPGFSNRKSAEALGLRLSATRAQSYNELFNIHVAVHCYNEQEHHPGSTGAVVRIIIKPNRKWKDQLPGQSS